MIILRLFNLLLIIFIVIVLLWNCNDWFLFLFLDCNNIYYSDLTVIVENSYNNIFMNWTVDFDDDEKQPECKFRRRLMYDLETKKFEHVIMDINGNKDCDIWELLDYLEELESEGKTEPIDKKPIFIGIACMCVWIGYYAIQYSKYFKYYW